MSVNTNASPALNPRMEPAEPNRWRTLLFGLQHVLVMYTGAVTVPLVFGAAVGLDPSQIAALVNADLLVCGLITILQAVGVRKVLGARMPVVAGASFTAVTPMILIGEEYGLSAVWGSMIAAGLFGLLIAGPFAKMLRFFPAAVRGAAVTMIGLSLIGKAVSMITGEGPTAPAHLALAAGIIVLIVVLMHYGKGFWSQASVLIALVAGTVVAAAMSMTDFSAAVDAPWLGLPQPFMFGAPTFPLPAVISMCVVMLVIFTESTAYLLSVGETTGKPTTQPVLARGLAADGASAVLGGFLTSFPDTVFAQNVSLLRLSGVTSRRVVTCAGIILVALGSLPKMGEFVAALPGPVIGAVSLVMFATVAGVGITSLAQVDYVRNSNLLIVSLALGVGMIPIVAGDLVAQLPAAARIVFGNAIASAAITAFALNLLFHHLTPALRRTPNAPTTDR
ncbi:nucleobase:cation symporter-2 family protein [Dietzia kunjamensis]|uniref:nucleobase:cation symporter-2 family protein n=2 Tax=Dietzia TaxID=37914 RepID=UPI00209753FE|nr:nucleobase:cation symporter-2 family protein [Dietzia kunjamensis]USX46016.1 purine permease [Dietzia kunjamensis]